MHFISINLISKVTTLKAGKETRFGKVMDWSCRVISQDTLDYKGAYLEHCHLV